jgi:non-ribosomal peptide synthetase component F
MKPSDNLVSTLLSIWKSGAAYLPLDVSFPRNRIEEIVKESKPILVIYDEAYETPDFFSSVPSMTFEAIKKDSLEMEKTNLSDEIALSKSNSAIVLYTSGSTGKPKGVRLSHQKVNHRNQWQMRVYPFTDTEKCCIFKTSLIFVDHIGEIWCPLFSARTLIVVPKKVVKNPEQLVAVLEEYKIERLLGVPTLLRSVLLYLNMLETNQSKQLLSHLKMWISSGEKLPLNLCHEFFDYFGEDGNVLVNFYGCTELTSDAATYDLRSRKQLEKLESIPIGFAVQNSKIYVMNEKMKPVNEGEIGEIFVAGVIVSDGYIAGRLGAFMNNPMDNEERELIYFLFNSFISITLKNIHSIFTNVSRWRLWIRQKWSFVLRRSTRFTN